MITVVGLGPAGEEHLTLAARAALEEAELVSLRTRRHPAAAAVARWRPDAVSFDELYEAAGSFDEVYSTIVRSLLEEGAQRRVCYAVPGSPTVLEQTVLLLKGAAPGAGVELSILPAVSFLDLAFDRMEIDPLSSRLSLVEADSFAAAAATSSGPLLVGQVWSKEALSSLKLALEEPAESQRAVLLHHLGLGDEVVRDVAWAELDRTLAPDHLTSVYVPLLVRPAAAAVASLVETVARLRQQCPWDREQTHTSLVRYLLEEAHEAIEALEGLGPEPEAASSEAVAHAEEELGDLLCQVVMHAALAREEGLFDFADIVSSLESKLVSRHPHVFADAVAETAADVRLRWEEAKDREKGRIHLLDGIPSSIPALARAEKIERKLNGVGLGWEVTGEEPGELVRRLDGLLAVLVDGGGGEAEEEAGRVLLSLARRMAAAGLDPEAALRRRLAALAAAVVDLEERASRSGRPLADLARADLPEDLLPLC